MQTWTTGLLALALVVSATGCGNSKPDNYKKEFGSPEQIRKDHVAIPPSAQSGGDADRDTPKQP